MSEHEHAAGADQAAHSAHKDAHQSHQNHHAHMAADFRQRLWISLALSLPILALSPLLQRLVGLREAVGFAGDLYVLFGFSTAVFWYGGWPFLKALITELKSYKPGMMTLVAVAISTAYLHSSAVVFGLTGKVFFWELATLVEIMLLGHWIEMKSVMGASKALEELAKLMPSDAHQLMPGGSVKDVPLSELAVDDQVLVKPGEKVPADGDILEGASSVNQAMLTGESTPVSKTSGGSINAEWALTIAAKWTENVGCRTSRRTRLLAIKAGFDAHSLRSHCARYRTDSLRRSRVGCELVADCAVQPVPLTARHGKKEHHHENIHHACAAGAGRAWAQL
jgi:Cu2+-exporting ATPase